MYKTYSQSLVDPSNFSEADVSIHDIAHHLAYQCRYNGACDRFYSVAQHSVILSSSIVSLMEAEHGPVRTAEAKRQIELGALMHDASEAYLGDIISPVKVLLPDYTQIEARVQEVIARRFNLPDWSLEVIKPYDKRIVVDEMEVLFATGVTLQMRSVPRLGVAINPVGPEEAEKMFLAQFRYLNSSNLREVSHA